jgi:hypothetical protein
MQEDFKSDFGKRVKVTKLQGVEDAFHPNPFAAVGEVFDGIFQAHPHVGDSFQIAPISAERYFRGLTTSPVREIINNRTFKTYNSIYKFELEDDVVGEVLTEDNNELTEMCTGIAQESLEDEMMNSEDYGYKHEPTELAIFISKLNVMLDKCDYPQPIGDAGDWNPDEHILWRIKNKYQQSKMM